MTEKRTLKKRNMVLWAFDEEQNLDWEVRKGFLEEVSLGLSSERLRVK